MTLRRRILYLSIVLLIMLDTCRRMLLADTNLTEPIRLIDWVMLVVEILVLVIIAAEAVYGIVKHYRIRRITKIILVFIEEGQILQGKVPRDVFVADDTIVGWNNSAQIWMDSVETFLKVKCSRHAAATFRHYIPNQQWSGVLLENNKKLYMDLLMRLENLQSILENPDVYF